jgi:hypothetical protein
LLDNLGVEPLEGLFDNEYLYTCSHKKQQNIKAFIMDSKVVVGVGLILCLTLSAIESRPLILDNACYFTITLHAIFIFTPIHRQSL